jgi:hypothetical protein
MPEIFIRWYKDKCHKDRDFVYRFNENIVAIKIVFFIAVPIMLIITLCKQFVDYTYYAKVIDNETKQEYELKCDDANSLRTWGDTGAEFTYQGKSYEIKNFSIVDKKYGANNFGKLKEEHCK